MIFDLSQISLKKQQNNRYRYLTNVLPKLLSARLTALRNSQYLTIFTLVIMLGSGCMQASSEVCSEPYSQSFCPKGSSPQGPPSPSHIESCRNFIIGKRCGSYWQDYEKCSREKPLCYDNITNKTQGGSPCEREFSLWSICIEPS